jgi:P27 family predicted phage terminase small subunit
MGRHGPAPEPVAAKLARGETRPSRVNFESPIPTSGLPPMPGDMSEVAKRVWRRVVQQMPPGVITGADYDLLRVYCEAVARYKQAMKSYYKTGPLIRARRDSSQVVKNPLGQVVRDTAEQIRLVGRELGLSPAARAGMRIDMGELRDDVNTTIGLPPRLRVVNE